MCLPNTYNTGIVYTSLFHACVDQKPAMAGIVPSSGVMYILPQMEQLFLELNFAGGGGGTFTTVVTCCVANVFELVANWRNDGFTALYAGHPTSRRAPRSCVADFSVSDRQLYRPSQPPRRTANRSTILLGSQFSSSPMAASQMSNMVATNATLFLNSTHGSFTRRSL